MEAPSSQVFREVRPVVSVIADFKQYFSDLKLANHVELFKIAGARRIVYRIFSSISILAIVCCLLSHIFLGNPSSFRDVLGISSIMIFIWFWLHLFLVASHIVIKDGMLTFVDYFIKRRSFPTDRIVDASRGYLDVHGNVERVVRFVYSVDAERELYGYFDVFQDFYSRDDVVMICKALGYDGLVLLKVGKHAREKDALVAGFDSDEERQRSILEDEADKEFYRNIRREQIRKMPVAILLGVLVATAAMTLTVLLTRLF